MKVSRVVEMVLSNYKGASKEKFENQQEREKITAFYTMLLDPNQDGAVSIEEFISFMQYFGPLDKCVDKIAAVKDEDWFMWVNTATGDIDDPFGESVDGRQDVVGTFGIRQSRQVGCFTYMVKLPDGKGSYYIEKIRIINDPGSDTKPSDGKDAVHREGGKYYWLMSAPIGSAAKYLQMSAANLKHAKDLIEKQLRSRYREQRFQFVPYKDLNMDVVMQVGGETFVYKLKVFLNENFRNTRLHTYFSNYKNCKRGMVHRFDEDPEIFRRVIRYYLHVTVCSNQKGPDASSSSFLPRSCILKFCYRSQMPLYHRLLSHGTTRSWRTRHSKNGYLFLVLMMTRTRTMARELKTVMMMHQKRIQCIILA